MRWYRRPALHFVVVGVALFVVSRAAAPPPAAQRPTVVITAARLAQLRADFGKTGPPPDERILVDRAVDEEILFREAVARSLDRDDPSIRWRVVEKMRFLIEGDAEAAPTAQGDMELYRKAIDLGLDRDDTIVRGTLVEQMRLLLRRSSDDAQPPPDTELQDYLGRHGDCYLQPARTSFWHVFLARDRRGAALDRDARALLDQLRALPTPPAEAVRRGDAFQAGSYFRAQSAQDLTHIFGSEFAADALAREPGSWVGPIRSAYGLHLIRVEEKQPARMPSLEAVRPTVLAQYRYERQEARGVAALQALRAKYDVRVEQAGERR